jgi:hypothetical protein
VSAHVVLAPPRSKMPSDNIIRTERRRPVLTLTEQLCAALNLRDGPATGSQAVG